VLAAAVLAAAQVGPAAAADGLSGGQIRAYRDGPTANANGPLAKATAMAPGLINMDSASTVAEAEFRGQWRAVHADGLLWTEAADRGSPGSHARFNELYGSADIGAWQASAGKRIVAWDVGYGFRPNDVVQQEARRTLIDQTPEGRPLVQVEHFDADTAWAMVWAHPGAGHDRRFAEEEAVAVRVYRRAGPVDWHGFGRWGRHTGASVGAAMAWVASDEVELHFSLRAEQRRDGWRMALPAGAADAAPQAVNPWQVATLGSAAQALVGMNWTGERQQSLTAEYWHDGNALSDAQWRGWGRRNRALTALPATTGLPPGAVTGIAANLAWQASPFGSVNLRRDNLFFRLAWQPGPWLASLDALVTPADGGRVVTAALQWQGDRWRLNAAWRTLGGRPGAVIAQLPTRQQGLIAATWAF
jgi:hypothetical protein